MPTQRVQITRESAASRGGSGTVRLMGAMAPHNVKSSGMMTRVEAPVPAHKKLSSVHRAWLGWLSQNCPSAGCPDGDALLERASRRAGSRAAPSDRLTTGGRPRSRPSGASRCSCTSGRPGVASAGWKNPPSPRWTASCR